MGPGARSAAALLAAACGFGSVSVLAKLAYAEGSTPSSLLAVRLLVAALLLAAIGLPAVKDGRHTIDAGQLALAAAAGVAFAGAGRLEFEALSTLPAPTVVVLVFIAPVWVALGSWVVWRTRLGRTSAGLVGLTLVGVALLVGTPTGETTDSSGIGLALAASVLAAAFYVLMEPLVKRAGARPAAALMALAAALCVAVLEPRGAIAEIGSSATAWYGLAIGTLTGCALWLVCAGLRNASALFAATIIGAEPLAAGLLSWVALGEVLSETQVIGAMGVLVGVTGMAVVLARSSRPHLPGPPPLVEPDGGDEDHAHHHVLPEPLHASDQEAVGQDHRDEHADHRRGHQADAAG